MTNIRIHVRCTRTYLYHSAHLLYPVTCTVSNAQQRAGSESEPLACSRTSKFLHGTTIVAAAAEEDNLPRTSDSGSGRQLVRGRRRTCCRSNQFASRRRQRRERAAPAQKRKALKRSFFQCATVVHGLSLCLSLSLSLRVSVRLPSCLPLAIR